MRIVLTVFLFLIFSSMCYAQGPQAYFNTSANHYVHERNQEALKTIQEGLKKYPNDPKLKALGNKLKQEEQQRKEQEKKDQQQKEQEKKDQEQKDKEKQEQEKE